MMRLNEGNCEITNRWGKFLCNENWFFFWFLGFFLQVSLEYTVCLELETGTGTGTGLGIGYCAREAELI